MAEITLTIDNRQIKANEGETLLAIARANGIYIPALCALTRCSPTLACRLCMVDADGKRVYACNAKAKEAMVVVTDSEEIAKERQAIMQVYTVNHPLACGVCDKSGECELQNNTHFLGVKVQDFAAKEIDKKPVKWGKTHYDPALCIVCERCVTVCKDMIGVAALSTVPRGAEPLAENYKESMPKDAYTVWNKMNKSLIGHSAKGDNCTDCGECAAVCPTGAMIISSFQYTSNAWELRGVPSSCVLCPSACHLIYEVKQAGIDNPAAAIYRVKNDFHFESLCQKGRFEYAANGAAVKDEAAFERAVAAFKRAKTIRFTSAITNEELLILARLKTTLGISLINPEAQAFAEFLRHFARAAGKTLHNGSRREVGDFVVSIGLRLSEDNPALRYAIANAVNVRKGAAVDFHPAADPIVDTLHKNLVPLRAKAGEEERVLFCLLAKFAESLPPKLAEKVAPHSFDAAQLDTIDKLLDKKERFTLIAGYELFENSRAENIAKLLGLIQRHTPFSVILAPKSVNSLGAALITQLDETSVGYAIGYNTDGDFVLSSSGARGENSLDMPALIQQEGTLTNLDRRVVPINQALPYNGYTLADIANALGVSAEQTVDFTGQLPIDAGYEPIGFDELQNDFGADGSENRGYLLREMDTPFADEIEPLEVTEQKGSEQ